MLSDEVIANINNFLPGFRKWLETDDGKEFLRERDEKMRNIKNLLSRDAIEGISEQDFTHIIASLWAYGWVKKKEYLVNTILESTDFNTLKSELKNLLYGSAPLAERYDRFFEIVKGIGPAGVTEILTFFDPSRYGIWNDKSRRALDILGLGEVLRTKKYKISGSEYEKVVEALKSISKVIEPDKAEPDLLNVDSFFYFIVAKAKEEVAIEEDYDFDHDEIVEKLVELGSNLGFEARREVEIAKGSRVDVVWRAEITNLGVVSHVSHVFEVQKGGSIDSLILNLQRAKKKDPTVQRLVVVANTKNLKTVRGEVETLGEEFRDSIVYMEAKDVLRASELLNELKEIMMKLESVKS
ncbi:MAG: hypothetical protein QXO16_08640 [Archaeoglobaceae archaeon]